MTEAVQKWYKEHRIASIVGSVVVAICALLVLFAPGLPGYVTTLLFLVVAIAWGLFTWGLLSTLSNVPTARAPAWRVILLLLLLAVALGSPWWVPRVLH